MHDAIIVLLCCSPFLLCCSQVLLDGTQGWRANPEVIERHQQRRPEFIWTEEEVPPYELPDVLRSSDGSVVGSTEAWSRRREEIMELFRTQMYGRRPGAPEHLDFEVLEEDLSAMGGAATLKRIAVRSRQSEREHSFELVLFLPNSEGPVPVFLLLNNRGVDITDPSRVEQSGFWPAEEVIDRGYGIAALQNNDLAPDDAETFHEQAIRLFEGDGASGPRAPDAWAALAAWGWGASRAMDYFETESRIDAGKVAVLGHSRGGKAALWAGAEDERFALTISNESGAGGAALSRRRFGETVQAVNRFRHWFTGNFDRYEEQEHTLPFDQHQLIAMMAPRAVYVASADEDLWADPRGEFLSLAHASPVYALFGYTPVHPEQMPPLDKPLFADRRGYHVRPGGHDLTPLDWRYFMDFADQLWR